MEACQIRIVGDQHMELMQGRPFGFEVECVTGDGQSMQGNNLSVSQVIIKFKEFVSKGSGAVLVGN